MDEPTCTHLEQLRRAGPSHGHLGASLQALPLAVPVTFVVEDDAVVAWGPLVERFRDRSMLGRVVAFQAEGTEVDADGERRGWSLVALGVGEGHEGRRPGAVCIPLQAVRCDHFPAGDR